MTPTIVDITPQQQKLWGDTRAAMIWHCPAFTHILYTMMNKAGGEHFALFTPEVPVAATDGQNILLNPETFFPLSLSERVFVVAHEIMHGIFGHCEMIHKLRMTGKVHYPDGTELGFDQEDMNRAMDYVINDMLVQSKIGSYNSNWLWDTTIATEKDSVLTAYRRIHQDKKSGGGGGGGGNSGQKSFDNHLDPGTTTGQDASSATSNRNEMEWKTAIAGAMATAKAQGKLPAGLERLFGDILEPQVDWTDKIIGFFARNTGAGTYNWRKPDRRLVTRDIIAPGRTGFGAGDVVIAIDTSGSIGQRELDVFFGEMAGIMEDVRPTCIHLMYCDAEVHDVVEVYDPTDLHDVRQRKAPGGGGTAFQPVFDKVRELDIEPDALVYLTDGYAPFPKKAPGYPVIWGSTSGVEYPWGEVVEVPVK